jgi:hypothetical protein
LSEHSETTREPRPVVGWHPLDPLSLVAGLLAVAFALAALTGVDVDGRVVVPVLLVAGGVVGAVSVLRRR